MKPTLAKRTITIALALFSAQLMADTVDVKGGARIVGKVTKIDGGSVVVATDYAGTVTIKQSEVTSITTDAPVAVRLASGTRVDGKVTGSAGSLQIAGAEGTISTTVDKVAASWAAGGKDPAIAALERGWAYEAAVDVSGKTGNKEQLGTAFSFRATLAGSQDTLQFYTAYDRQVTDGDKSADQFRAGVDYANNFSGRKSWYVRNEAGFDRVKDIELYNVAAFGLGYDFIKEAEANAHGSRRCVLPLRRVQEPADDGCEERRFGLRPRPPSPDGERRARQPPLLRPDLRGFRQLRGHPRELAGAAAPVDPVEAPLGRGERLQQRARPRREEARYDLLHPARAELEVIVGPEEPTSFRSKGVMV
jgi:hypothetical protein